MYDHQELVEITESMFEKAGIECVPYNNERAFTREEIQNNCDKMLKIVKEISS